MKQEHKEILYGNVEKERQMIDSVIKIIYDHIKSGKPINRKLIESVINTYLDNEVPVLDGISFVNNDLSSTAYYSPVDNYIHIDCNSVVDWSKNEKIRTKKTRNIKNIGDNSFYMYKMFLTVIFHELTHAKQYYLIREDHKSYPILFSSTSNMEQNYLLYEYNHDLFPVERYANIRGNYLANEILSAIYKEEHLLRMAKHQEFEYLWNDYVINDADDDKFLSPLEIYNDLIQKQNIIVRTNSQKSKRLIGNYETEDGKLTQVYLVEDNELKSEKFNKKRDLIEITHDIPYGEDTKEMSVYDKVYLGAPISMEEYEEVFLKAYDDCFNGLDNHQESVKKTLKKYEKTR